MASEGLSAYAPDLSARSGATIAQRLFGWLFAGGLFYLLLVNPVATFTAIEITLGTVLSAIIFLRIMATLGVRRQQPDAARNPDSQLPVITLLVPLHQEAKVAPALINALMRLDFLPTSSM